jgi:hypothetical protein
MLQLCLIVNLADRPGHHSLISARNDGEENDRTEAIREVNLGFSFLISTGMGRKGT